MGAPGREMGGARSPYGPHPTADSSEGAAPHPAPCLTVAAPYNRHGRRYLGEQKLFVTVAYIDQQEVQHKIVINSYARKCVHSTSHSQTSSALIASSNLTCVCAELAFCTRFKRSVDSQS